MVISVTRGLGRERVGQGLLVAWTRVGATRYGWRIERSMRFRSVGDAIWFDAARERMSQIGSVQK
jgi:hypothetical protein